MKFIKYLIFFIILQGCSSNYEWGWYILSPNNIEGLTNLKFLISGITTTKIQAPRADAVKLDVSEKIPSFLSPTM